MKPAGLLLFIPAGLVAVFATEESSPGLTSRETKARIREGLPSYRAPPPKTGGVNTESPTIEPTPAANVLILPKMIVQELRLPSDAADHLMSERDFNRKMENLYLDTIAEDGPLNVVLNSIAIPILNQVSIPLPPRFSRIKDRRAVYRSVEIERGRAIYRAKEIERLGHVADVGKNVDPSMDKKFKDDIDHSHTTRPPARK